MRSDVVCGDRAPDPRPTGQDARAGRARAGARLLAVACTAALSGATACSASSPPTPPGSLALDPPGPGLVFSYPADGQFDVPTRARILLVFSEPIPAGVNTDCTSPAAALCVEGPDGLVSGALTVQGSILALSPAGGLAEGTTYRVWARPALLPGATNLRPRSPMLTFHTRSPRIRAGEAATVVTVNGVPLAADGTSPQPLLDVAPIRLLFSEPLDRATLDAASVRLLHVADGAAVEGVILAKGIHLTFQPAAPLVAGDAYRLELGAAVRDQGGEPIAPVGISFEPRRTTSPGHGPYPLSLNVTPAWSEGVAQPLSRLSTTAANTNVLASQLIGTCTQGVLAGGLDVEVRDPHALGTTLSMLIRRGQRLDLTSTPIRHGGVLETGLQTGTTHFTLLTDAVGFVIRNPYRAAEQVPDDVQSPTWMDLTMDAVISSEDGQGNTLSSQTVLGVRLLGISTAGVDGLVVDQVGAIDFDLLGVDTAPVALAMRMQTGSRAPTPELGLPFLFSTYPANGAQDVPPADPIELNFSGPLDPSHGRGGGDVTLIAGAASIPVSTRLEGTTLVVVPSRRLEEGARYTVGWTGLRSMAGADVADGTLSFTTAITSAAPAVPPIIKAMTPGAPCALSGGTATSPGRCAAGQASDAPYQPFTLPANRDVRVIFSQPIAPDSLTLGAACDQGSVRVERLDAAGGCAGVVRGTLVKRDRELRFLPNAPWAPGTAYRVTLVAGANGTCAAGEVCGRNGKPLNSDPLAGAAAASGGGPDVAVSFTGAPATIDTYQPLASDPVADLDASGYLDATERANDQNRVAMELAGYGGLITAASLAGPDCLPDRPGTQVCSYLDATLPSSIQGVLASCPIDAQGRASTAPIPCVQVRVFPSVTTGTSIATNSTAAGYVPLFNLPTGVQLMRLRETDGPIHGYILNEAGAADPQFVVTQDLYLDAPDLVVPFAAHDFKSKPLRVTLKGPVTFGRDGRMRVALRSLADVSLRVTFTSFTIPGNIDFLIPAGEMRLTISGPPLR